MPELQDRNLIRSILETDRWWAAYALADLEPGYFEHSVWFVPRARLSATVLVYSGFEMPIVLAAGDAGSLVPVFEELRGTLRRHATIYFVIRPEVLPLLQRDYAVNDRRPMLRMVLEADRFPGEAVNDAVDLGPGDLESVAALFRDGVDTGEAPDCFVPSMLENGVYCGVREGRDLVAVAGTHVFAPTEGVGGLGNIYTRRDRRGLGLGTRVTAAVVSKLLRRSVPTIVLNVNEANAPAIRVYERLGFRVHCPYFEIIASPAK